MELIRTDSSNISFHELVGLLDAYLSVVDGAEHTFYHQYNQIDKLNNVIVAFADGQAVACGAFKPLDSSMVEIKRMWTQPRHRGHGLAGMVLKELETWAAEIGYTEVVLETGRRMPDAIALYEKHGYQMIQNYGQYVGVENSICFKKQLNFTNHANLH